MIPIKEDGFCDIDCPSYKINFDRSTSVLSDRCLLFDRNIVYASDKYLLAISCSECNKKFGKTYNEFVAIGNSISKVLES